MTKVMIYTAMHGRHMVSRLWCEGVKRFIAESPSNILCDVFVVVDDHPSERLCIEYGFDYGWHSNDYLGKKFNAGLKNIMEWYTFDYLLITGSDDLIFTHAWDAYLPCIERKQDYFGFESIYFYSVEREEAIRFSYASAGQPSRLVGCGRMISISALKNAVYYMKVQFRHDFHYAGINYRVGDQAVFLSRIATYLCGAGHATPISNHFGLWNDLQQHGMDNESEMRLIVAGYSPKVIFSDMPFMIDIKTEENIWKYKTFNFVNDIENLSEVFSYLGEKERSCLKTLTPCEGVKMS